MKKCLLILMLLCLIIGCQSHSPDDYIIISESPVDGYDIYQLEHHGFLCNNIYQDIYYSDANYNYGFSFQACSHDMSFFIKHEGEYIYLKNALRENMLTMESLLPEMSRFEREPEEISTEEADYYWLDYYIMGDVVYAYAGGVCDFADSEVFFIDGKEYAYDATGCLKTHILFMEVDREYVPVATLLEEGQIDGKYLIPLLRPLT